MKQVIDISSYLIDTFRAELVRENWRFACPFCGDEGDHMGVSLYKGTVHCFRCDYANSVLGFLCDYEVKTPGQIYRMLRQYPLITIRKPRRTEPKGRRFRLRDIGYRALSEKGRDRLWWLGKAYAEKRGLTAEDIRKYRLGVAEGDDYFGRLIVPCFEDKKLVYFVGRKLTGPGPKYKNPSKEVTGYGSSRKRYP